jgi:hypothetical protein
MALRAPLQRNKPRRTLARSQAVVSPVEGWDASSALASMPAKRAVQLKNWFPQPGYVEVRRGYRWHAWDLGSSPKTVSSINTGTDTFTSNSHGLANGTQVKVHAATTLPAGLSATRVYFIINTATNTFQLSLTSGGSAVDVSSSGSGTVTVYEVDEPTVETLAVWQGPSSSKLFAAAGGAIWDVTAASAGTFAYTPAGGSNRWQSWMHTTSGGAYLFMVNGTDAPIHYDGSSWTAPTITGITASDAVTGITHKKRIWLVLNNSTKAAYLGTEAVAGAATEFQFGSLFTRGGYLLALATWTRDGGSGADDYLVAISSRGQVALYQGTDPASANTWALVGVFDVPTPIGRRCFTRFGADVLLITVEGVFPLSQLLSVDQSQAERVAISERISQAFNDAAISYSSNWGWEACVYPRGTRLIVNIPTTESSTARQYVMNTLTGAWCEFDNHNANTWVVYNDNLYFAGNAGDVYRADTGRADIARPITAIGQTAYSAFGTPQLKRFSMTKPLITASGSNRPALGISVDFVETQNLSTFSGSAVASGALWDSASWDSSSWGGADVQISDWSTVPALGTFGSLKFQAQTGVDVGSSGWGVSVWGDAWGSEGQSDETMRIQGFVILHEQGEYL